jgi:hypothetical protein
MPPPASSAKKSTVYNSKEYSGFPGANDTGKSFSSKPPMMSKPPPSERPPVTKSTTF